MRVQDLRTDEARAARIAAPVRRDSHYRDLREAADELLREFTAIADWSHPTAERYRRIRSQAPDFGADE